MPQRNKGFTLVETAIFLLIAGAIIYAVVTLVTNKKDEANAEAFVTEIQDLITKINKAGLLGAGFSDNNSLIRSKVLPSTWVVSGSNITTSGGETVSSSIQGWTPPNGILVDFGGITSARCIKLLTFANSNSKVNGLISNGSWVRSINTAPVTYNAIANQCRANNAGNSSLVILTR